MRTAFMLKLRARNDPVHVAKRIQDTKEKISLLEHRSEHTSVELAELHRLRSLLLGLQQKHDRLNFECVTG